MIAASPHKPRKKKKELPSARSATSNHILTTHQKTAAAGPAFPLVSFLWPARGINSQWITLPLILMAVGLFRWTAGFWGYSGKYNI